MSATSIFILGIVGAAVLAAAGIFTVAVRRGSSAGPVTGTFDRRAVRKDRQRVAAAATGGGVATIAEPETDTAVEADAAPPEEIDDSVGVTPLVQKRQISAAEYGVTRRQFFNRAIIGLFGGVFLGSLGLGILAFLWPKLKGGFGSKIVAGSVADLRNQIINSDGTLSPLFFPAAQSWLVPIDDASIPGSSFEGLSVAAGGGAGEPSLMALWQRCVHLGCRVPSCESSQGFECPCHGSKYNFHGEYQDGPAPRNMDRFVLEIDDATGDLVIDTGQVIQTPRSKVITIPYPQGPTCL
ncbi:MAG: Rieske 2Fe-2S domain-containing protein [Acidimicrobiia bacterium]|nr:Rieske 2Fe-2S domain-containing protein [Acidimicrobiia bacterium]